MRPSSYCQSLLNRHPRRPHPQLLPSEKHTSGSAGSHTCSYSGSEGADDHHNPDGNAWTMAGFQARRSNVYNDQNEKLGDINEILLDQGGKVNGVIIGVGGFLGMGEREIMVTMDKLRFVNEPYRATTTTTTPATTTTTTPATTTTTTGELRPRRQATALRRRPRRGQPVWRLKVVSRPRHHERRHQGFAQSYD